jgi:hypothetical protein
MSLLPAEAKALCLDKLPRRARQSFGPGLENPRPGEDQHDAMIVDGKGVRRSARGHACLASGAAR